MIDITVIEATVDSVPGLSLAGEPGRRVVAFAPEATLHGLRALVAALRAAGAVLSVYDPLWPSISDPGGYFTYAPQKAAPERWSMTYGNHGWSGGLYQIDDETIARQVYNLWQKGHLARLSFEHGRLLANKQPHDNTASEEMAARIRALHSEAG